MLAGVIELVASCLTRRPGWHLLNRVERQKGNHQLYQQSFPTKTTNHFFPDSCANGWQSLESDGQTLRLKGDANPHAGS